MTSPTDRAAFEAWCKSRPWPFNNVPQGESWHIALEAWQAATAAERERAAKVCQTESVVLATRDMSRGALHCAAAIRSGA
jgi:hypothetical protein